jgi:spermidine synthase
LNASPRPPAGLLLLVLASGMSALIYELVWIRALGMWFGTTAGAITTVVSAFMAGLALGSAWLGRVADRHPRPLQLYAMLELGVAASALLVSLLVLRGAPLLVLLARLVDAAGPAAGFVRALVVFAVLLVPATLMGGTLPVLARAFVRTRNAGGALGTLYAANTAGAVAGALLPDGLLIPLFGLTAAALFGVVGNLGVALGARRLASDTDPLPPIEPEAPSDPAATWASPAPSRLAFALFSVSGFAAMGYEVLWSRVLEHLVASLALSFAVLLAVYLVALAIGARLATRLADRVANPLAWATGLVSGSAALVFAPLVLLPRWNAFVAPMTAIPPDLVRTSVATWWTSSLVHSLYLEAGSCLLMGAAFPMVAAAVVRAGSAGRTMGVLYAANTLAGVVGAFTTGFVLLPALGVERTFAVLAISCAAVSTLVAFWARLKGSQLVVPSLATLGVALAAALLPADHFRNLYLRAAPEFVVEGTTTSVAVVKQAKFGEDSWLELKTPGVSMSDTRFGSRRYMAFMGHLPLFLAHERRSALLICFGVGNTARAILSHPEIERFDIVDIAPEVFAASPWFARLMGSDPLKDPRVNVIVGDGRAHLVSTRQKYDVITSEPPPPNHAGVVNLYSREYYAAARAALTPGGVVAQWLPVMQLHSDESLAMVAAMAAEFKWVSLYVGYWYQWIVVGSDAPPTIDVEGWRRVAAMPTTAADLAASGARDIEDLLGAQLADDATLRAAVEDVTPVTDDLPILPYPWREIRLPVLPPPGLVSSPEVLLSALGRPSWPQLDAATRSTRYLVASMPLLYLSPLEYRELALGTSLRAALSARPGDLGALGMLDLDDETLDAARRALVRDPRHVDAGFALARRAFYDGDWQATLNRLQTIDPRAVNTPTWWLLKGGSERALGRFDEARRAFETAAQLSASAPFRKELTALAANPTAPWPAEFGPLARP